MHSIGGTAFWVVPLFLCAYFFDVRARAPPPPAPSAPVRMDRGAFGTRKPSTAAQRQDQPY